MPLELVHDAAKVSELPVSNLMDIGGMARRYADDIDKGEYGKVERAVIVTQRTDGSLYICGWGENSSAYELMGLFEAAKLRVFADDAIPDE